MSFAEKGFFMTYTDTFTWAVTLLCLVGTLFNVYKLPACFVFWSIGNIAWLFYDLQVGLYSRAFLDLLQLAFSLWGLWMWKKKHPAGSSAGCCGARKC